MARPGRLYQRVMLTAIDRVGGALPAVVLIPIVMQVQSLSTGSQQKPRRESCTEIWRQASGHMAD